MIGIDANVLVRYIVQDDAAQSVAATRLREKRCSQEEPGLVSAIVVCELVWVLQRAYGYEKRVIVEVLQRVLDAAELHVEHGSAAREALGHYRDGDADYSDYLIARTNAAAGAKMTFTFDRKAAAHRLFRLLD